MIGKQKHLWQSRRFAKKTRDFRFAGLCALAPLREILYFFTRSELFRISGRQSRWPFTPLFHRSDGKFRFVFWSRPFVFNNSSALFRKSAFAKTSHVPSWWRSMDYFPSSNATESARTADFAKPWLRSRFLPAPILCYQSNRWLRFSKVRSFESSALSFWGRFASPPGGSSQPLPSTDAPSTNPYTNGCRDGVSNTEPCPMASYLGPVPGAILCFQ